MNTIIIKDYQPKAIRTSDIYTRGYTIPHGYEFVDFKPPQPNDLYISAPGGSEILSNEFHAFGGSPRIIVHKIVDPSEKFKNLHVYVTFENVYPNGINLDVWKSYEPVAFRHISARENVEYVAHDGINVYDKPSVGAVRLVVKRKENK